MRAPADRSKFGRLEVLSVAGWDTSLSDTFDLDEPRGSWVCRMFSCNPLAGRLIPYNSRACKTHSGMCRSAVRKLPRDFQPKIPMTAQSASHPAGGLPPPGRVPKLPGG